MLSLVQTFELADGAEVVFHSAWLGAPEADALFGALSASVPWKQKTIRMGAREVLEPRLTAWCGDLSAVYTYSGVTLQPLPWPVELEPLRARIEAVANCPFDSVLLNLYRDGKDSMGFHSDQEPELGPNPVIASLSLGAARRFVLRHRKDKSAPKLELELTHGSLLVMRGTTQHHYRHGVPKTTRVVGPRINLTFRRIVGARRNPG